METMNSRLGLRSLASSVRSWVIGGSGGGDRRWVGGDVRECERGTRWEGIRDDVRG